MKSMAVDLHQLLAVAACVLDADGILLEANAGFLRLLPGEPAQLIGTNISRFHIQPNFAALTAPGMHGEAGYRGLMTIGDPTGKTRTLRGRVWRTAGVVRLLAEYDIAELERLNDVILEMNRNSSAEQHTLSRANVALKQRVAESAEASLRDVLTGVGNRRRLEQGLAQEIHRARRGEARLGAMMADIDHFKSINDEYGHSTGDRVLAHFGAILMVHTRPTDIVARFGGEEFVVLMPDAGLADAERKANQIRASLASALIPPLARPVTLSMGVAELLPGENGASLLSRVDAALYQAKENGRNRVVAAT